MNAEHWQRVERLYHATLEKNADERAAFLDEACDGDESLRREVESLLSYEGQAKDFIESPVLEVAAKMIAQHEAATVSAGQTINQYRVTSRLGIGGMGEVFLAEDTRLGRGVALKFLPAVFTQDKKHLGRFEQEARAVAALSHPNVCTIHEVIETDEGRHCIVMEYVHGVTLRQRIGEGPMKVAEALEVAIQVASALAAAHEAGVVHRDIKPENIMVRRDDYVKVLDFGLAKLTEPEPALDPEASTKMLHTSPGMVMGTFSYMSPEQARGLPVDARTDVWSLGVVLFEMVSGQRPFQGETPTDVIVSIVEREPPSLSKSAPEATAELERITAKTLAKDRKARYQTAADLLTDLKSLKRALEIGAEVRRQKQPTVTAPAVTTNRQAITSQSFPFAGKHGRALLLASIAATLLVAVLVAARFLRRNSPGAPLTAVKSLAVLPLENVSGDSAQDYFADGITDALITSFAKVQTLRVTSRPAVMVYKKAGKSPAEIGRELKVDAALTGSVARNGDRVRVSLRLIHVATGQDLWSQDYDRELRAVPALQGEVTRDVAQKIGFTASPSPQTVRAASINAEAYDQYLRGQFYLNRQNIADNESAIGALEKAVAADPNFADAHAELAQAYVWKLFLFAPREKQLEEKAFVEVEKALALDPDSAVAYLARGRLQWTPANHFPHERSIKEYRHALSLDPTLDEAHNQLALVYSHIGALSQSLQESQFALAANPNNHLAQYRMGETLNWQGKYEEALSVLQAIPEGANPELVAYQKACALFNLGKKDQAAETLEQLLKDPKANRGLVRSVQAILAASAGQDQIAEEKIKTAIEQGQGFGHFHHTAYNIACAYALMNKPEQAIKWLQTAADDGFPCYPLFESDANLNNLRQDPRFVAFLAQQKQQWEYHKTLF
jgi:serine/threonine protein kinase/TolB-like protein/Tfp pilus assembly protein PilF